MKFTFAPEATPLAGYTIKRAIDRGGFGEVYYALSDSGKEVALKLLQRNQQVELRGVSQCLNLKHPNLVTIFDIRTDGDGDDWVIMEYVAGKSLELVLEENPRGLPLPEVEEWLAGMALGTAFLHDRGIVHRDLKPANVFRENGVVKIGDVGLSKFIAPSRRSAQTESVGTVYYMAPEVARGKYGSELDVYSLGVILYEMLTGHVPFAGESTGEILMKHLTEPPDLSKIPAQFRSVVGRALEKDPQRRTPGAAQLLDEFRRARQGKPVAEEIPASHFVDVPRLERSAGLRPEAAAAASRPFLNGNGATVHYPANANGRTNPFPLPQPPAPPPPLSRPSTSQPDGWSRLQEEFRRKPWLAVVVALGLFWLLPHVTFGPMGVGLAFSEIVILAGVGCLTFLIVKSLSRGGSTPSASGGRGTYGALPAAGAGVPTAPARPVTAAPAIVERMPGVAPCASRPSSQLLSPNGIREIPWRTRLSDLSGAMSMASVWGIVATAVVGVLGTQYSILNLGTQSQNLPGLLGLFGLTTILGAWAILVSSKFLEGTGADNRRRRLIQTALGAAVGACAFWLNEKLLVEIPYQNSFSGLIQHVGSYPLLKTSPVIRPTLAAYVLYFAALFGIRRWWWQADSFRPRRLRIGSLVLSGLTGFFVPAAFAFYQNWGVAWAVAISAVVQLSAPWVAARQRPALVQAKPASAPPSRERPA